METQFDEYKVTNGSIQWRDPATGTQEEAVKMGCVGKLEVETEIKTIEKKCEGVVVEEFNIPQKMTATFTGHLPVEVLRRGFGIKTEGLKAGVYSYGTDSIPGEGVLTFDVYDIYELVKMLKAYPRTTFSGGLKWSLENGAEEIAEVEISLTFLKDANNQFYYEAFEDEVTDSEVKTKWHTEFTPELVKAAPSAP